MLEVGVKWDQADQTVLLSDPANGVDMMKTMKAYFLTNVYAISAAQYQDADKQSMETSGIPCSHWLQLKLNRYAKKGKYDAVTFQYYSDKNVALRVLGDNDAVLAEIQVTGGQAAYSVDVPLMKTSQLTLQAEKLEETGLTVDQDIHVVCL